MEKETGGVLEVLCLFGITGNAIRGVLMIHFVSYCVTFCQVV
jgi:hypothetical protein